MTKEKIIALAKSVNLVSYYPSQDECIVAFYHAAQAEAFEAAANVAHEATSDMRFQQLRDYDFSARIARAIREMAKEMK